MNLLGIFRGVVVDDRDPERRGRYRVWVHGVHLGPAEMTYAELIRQHKKAASNTGIQNPAVAMYGGTYAGAGEVDGDGNLISQAGGGDKQVAKQTVDKPNFDGLPWAERILYGGKQFNDGGYYEIGDNVMVMFEPSNHHPNGDALFPIIIGSWITQRHNMDDLAPETTLGYPETALKWFRNDRYGQSLEISAYPDEMMVDMRAGRASVRVNALEDSVWITTTDGVDRGTDPSGTFEETEQYYTGSLNIGTGIVSVECEQSIFMLRELLVFGTQASNRETYGDKPGSLIGLYSEDVTEVYGSYRTWIGQYIDRTRIEGTGGSAEEAGEGGAEAYQGEAVILQSEDVLVGACKNAGVCKIGEEEDHWIHRSKETKRVHVWANKHIYIRTAEPVDEDVESGKKPVPQTEEGSEEEECLMCGHGDPTVSIAGYGNEDADDGNIVIWAHKNLVLAANGNVIIAGLAWGIITDNNPTGHQRTYSDGTFYDIQWTYTVQLASRDKIQEGYGGWETTEHSVTAYNACEKINAREATMLGTGDGMVNLDTPQWTARPNPIPGGTPVLLLKVCRRHEDWTAENPKHVAEWWFSQPNSMHVTCKEA